MNAAASRTADFAGLIQRFFLQRLIQQRNASPDTVAAYRDTFRLLLNYLEQHRHKSPQNLSLDDFDAPVVLDFLDFLETQRGNSIRSRNARLAALRAFAKYVALQCPSALEQVQQILASPMKRFDKPLLGFLSREEMRAILTAPDPTTWFGRRDRLLLAMLYNTGARVSEVIAIQVQDVILVGTPAIHLHGKGRKQRTVPLWKETAAEASQWIHREALRPPAPLLPNRHGQPMTRSNVAERIALATRIAQSRCLSLTARTVTPHSVRHTTAMHLLQSGVDLTVIALWLGHESPMTTHGYVEADLAMKEQALAAIAPPGTKAIRYHPKDKLLQFLESL
jgi:integrase/recombinase XerD